MSLPFETKKIPDWLEGDGPDKDVVLSSRVRLARNLSGHPFPDQASEETLVDLRDRLLEDLADTDQFNLIGLIMDGQPDRQKRLLGERRLISDELGDRPGAAVLFHPDQDHGMMVNEEDHLRIQAMASGYDLDRAREQARSLETMLAERMEFVRSERWGYLTSCPTNVGTGLRGSVLVQLPGLVLADEIDQIFKAVSNLGLTVRGFYGEGSESMGFYFQISNQVTMGRPVDELLGSLERVTEQVIQRERQARENLLDGPDASSIRDRIWRSVGILSHAREINSQEALQMLSFCRLGILSGELEGIRRTEVDRLLMRVQPAHLEARLGESLDSSDRDRYRAQCLRSTFDQRKRAMNSDE